MRIKAISAIVLLFFMLTGCGDSVAVNLDYFLSGEETGRAIERSETVEIVETSETVETYELPESTEEESAPVETEPDEKEYDIQLMMVGDNLMHMGIVRTGLQKDGSYNYDFLFDGIRDFLEEAEIRMINQETVFGGNALGFSGYPEFNSPTQVGDAIAGAGFNVVLHASNHAADQGAEGLLHCVDFWKQYPEVAVAGIHPKDESPLQIVTVGEVDLAILNYTYSANHAVLSEDVEGHLDMLCNYDDETGAIDLTQLHPDVLTDIAEAEEMADVVIVCPHWGNEYTTKPSVYQKKFAMEMTHAGADIIIGTHPHVVQPMEWIEAENGNRALCYYSLGNYVSTQKNPICMLEAMAWVNIHVAEDEITVSEENTGVIPMICHYTAGPVRLKQVYLLENYTKEQADSHGIKTYGEVDLALSDLQTLCEEVFGTNILSAEDVLASDVITGP